MNFCLEDLPTSEIVENGNISQVELRTAEYERCRNLSIRILIGGNDMPLLMLADGQNFVYLEDENVTQAFFKDEAKNKCPDSVTILQTRQEWLSHPSTVKKGYFKSDQTCGFKSLLEIRHIYWQFVEEFVLKYKL